MTIYTCNRCGYITNHKTNLVCHLKRKRPCESILDDRSPEDLLKELGVKQKVSTTKLNVNPEEYRCDFCKLNFASAYSLKRHITKCQQEKHNQVVIYEKKVENQGGNNTIALIQGLQHQLQVKDQQLAIKDKHIEELIAKAGNTNIGKVTNHITINAFNKTSFAHLTDNEYAHCMQQRTGCIRKLIELDHFNEQRPYNHNIYIKDVKSKYAMIYDGSKWVLGDQAEIINDLVDSSNFTLEQKLEEWIETGKHYPEIMQKFQEYLNVKEEDHVANKIKGEVQRMLYNKRSVCAAIGN